jgi:starch synthase
MVAASSTTDFSLNVVMLAAEAAPFAKVGGLADVVGALPKALEKLGVKPAIMIPAYRSVDLRAHQIKPCAAIPTMDIRMGANLERAEIYQTRIQDSSVDVYLIGSRRYFDRDGIYDDPITREGYADNMERFVFFMKSGIELLRRLRRPLDVIHCHDSHSALIPGMLGVNHRDDPMFSRAGTLLTIHNLAYQGLFPKESLTYAGIDLQHFYPLSPFEYWGQVNFLKAGIELADKVNTVSRTYAVEIRTGPEFGMGLEQVLQRREADLSGIVNGIDYDEWDPEKDPFIPAPFSVRDLSGKSKCKEALLEYFGLPRSGSRVPLMGIVSRLVDQKGFDLIAEAAEELTSLNLRLVILGMGQKKYQELFMRIASQHPEKAGVCLAFDNRLAHQIEAGCDFFLMPSKFEPCGLNQLYSLRYGTIPIVRAVGGLADTVVDYDRGEGTGFRFVEYRSGEMVAAIKRALAVYSDPERWRELIIRAMSQDWSWDRSAAEYRNLYRTIKSRVRR